MHLHSVTKEFRVGLKSGNFEIEGETISAVLDAAGGGDSDDAPEELDLPDSTPLMEVFEKVVTVLGEKAEGIKSRHWSGWVEELEEDGIGTTLGELKKKKNEWVGYITGPPKLKGARTAFVRYIQTTFLGVGGSSGIRWAWVVRKNTGEGV